MFRLYVLGVVVADEQLWFLDKPEPLSELSRGVATCQPPLQMDKYNLYYAPALESTGKKTA